MEWNIYFFKVINHIEALLLRLELFPTSDPVFS